MIYKIEDTYQTINHKLIKDFNYNNIHINVVNENYVINYITQNNWIKEQLSKQFLDKYYEKYRFRIIEMIKLDFETNKEKYRKRSLAEAKESYKKNYYKTVREVWLTQTDEKVTIPTNGWYYLKRAGEVIDRFGKDIRLLEK